MSPHLLSGLLCPDLLGSDGFGLLWCLVDLLWLGSFVLQLHLFEWVVLNAGGADGLANTIGAVLALTDLAGSWYGVLGNTAAENVGEALLESDTSLSQLLDVEERASSLLGEVSALGLGVSKLGKESLISVQFSITDVADSVGGLGINTEEVVGLGRGSLASHGELVLAEDMEGDVHIFILLSNSIIVYRGVLASSTGDKDN